MEAVRKMVFWRSWREEWKQKKCFLSMNIKFLYRWIFIFNYEDFIYTIKNPSQDYKHFT